MSKTEKAGIKQNNNKKQFFQNLSTFVKKGSSAVKDKVFNSEFSNYLLYTYIR